MSFNVAFNNFRKESSLNEYNFVPSGYKHRIHQFISFTAEALIVIGTVTSIAAAYFGDIPVVFLGISLTTLGLTIRVIHDLTYNNAELNSQLEQLVKDVKKHNESLGSTDEMTKLVKENNTLKEDVDTHLDTIHSLKEALLDYDPQLLEKYNDLVNSYNEQYQIAEFFNTENENNSEEKVKLQTEIQEHKKMIFEMDAEFTKLQIQLDDAKSQLENNKITIEEQNEKNEDKEKSNEFRKKLRTVSQSYDPNELKKKFEEYAIDDKSKNKKTVMDTLNKVLNRKKPEKIVKQDNKNQTEN